MPATSVATTYTFKSTDTVPAFDTPPYTPAGSVPTMYSKGVTLFSPAGGGVPTKGCVMQYFTMGPSGGTTTTTTGTQTLVSFGPTAPPIYQYGYNIMLATFSQPIYGGYPTVTTPFTEDFVSNLTMPTPYAFQFLWYPQNEGTGQTFTFSNIPGYVGNPILAQPVTVLPANTIVSIQPQTTDATIIQNASIIMDVVFSLPLMTMPTITPPNGGDTVGTPTSVSSTEITFSWTPSIAGTGQMFGFSNVTDMFGIAYAPALTVAPNTESTTTATVPFTCVSLVPDPPLVAGIPSFMTATFSYALGIVPGINANTAPSGAIGTVTTPSNAAFGATNFQVTFWWTPQVVMQNSTISNGLQEFTDYQQTLIFVFMAGHAYNSPPLSILDTAPLNPLQSLLTFDWSNAYTGTAVNCVAYFNLPTVIPTIIRPNTGDQISDITFNDDGHQLLSFNWTPSVAGNQTIQFQNVSGLAYGVILTTENIFVTQTQATSTKYQDYADQLMGKASEALGNFLIDYAGDALMGFF